MADVFISYKREDRRHAERLALALEHLGFDVWWDFDLLSGDPYRHVIRAVIDRCAAAIVIWSVRAIESDFVMDEAGYAKSQGKLCPIRIDGVELPFGFGTIHTNDLSDWEGELSHAGFHALVRGLETRIGRKAKLSTPERADAQMAAAELEAFKAAQLAGAPGALQSFLERFPRGAFSEFVRRQLEPGRAGSLDGTLGPTTSRPRKLRPLHWLVIALGAAAVIFGVQAVIRTGSRAQGSTQSGAEGGWLGASLRSLDAQTARAAGLTDASGAYITHVPDSTPAQRAGLRAGDVLLSLNRDAIRDAPSALERLAALRPGSTAAFVVMRGRSRLGISAEITAKPDDATIEQDSVRQPTAVSAHVATLTAAELDTGRYVQVSFYPQTELWEFRKRGADALVSYLAPREGPPVALDGSALPIYRYNAAVGFSLANAYIAEEYLRFFCSFVWGQAGPVQLIEKADDLPQAARAEHGGHARALNVWHKGTTYRTAATILYDGTLFAVELEIQSTGMVEMLNDAALTAERAVPQAIIHANGQRRPASLQGLSVEDWPLSAPLRGEWRNASDEQTQRMRQIIMTEGPDSTAAGEGVRTGSTAEGAIVSTPPRSLDERKGRPSGKWTWRVGDWTTDARSGKRTWRDGGWVRTGEEPVRRARAQAVPKPPAAGSDTAKRAAESPTTPAVQAVPKPPAAGSGTAKRTAERPTTSAAQAEAKNEEGKRVFRGGDAAGARLQFRDALVLDPQPRYAFHLCLAEEALGNLDAAVTACKLVLSMEPDAAMAEKVKRRLEIIAEGQRR